MELEYYRIAFLLYLPLCLIFSVQFIFYYEKMNTVGRVVCFLVGIGLLLPLSFYTLFMVSLARLFRSFEK